MVLDSFPLVVEMPGALPRKRQAEFLTHRSYLYSEVILMYQHILPNCSVNEYFRFLHGGSEKERFRMHVWFHSSESKCSNAVREDFQIELALDQ